MNAPIHHLSRRSPPCLLFRLLFLGGLLPATFLPAATQSLDGHNFTLQDGFIVERVAGPPLVDRPITAAFDEEGRLYVSDSSGSNDPVQKQLETRPHRIVRLEDTDQDGIFDHPTVFADKMMFPEGTLWFDGSLYVSAPPSIWKLTDSDNDGVADQREEWFQAKTLTGCANDLHGPYLGPDGWIYWCKGAFAEQTHTLPDGSSFVTRAAHVFRRHPSGGGSEPVMTGGMDNPIDVAFTPGGERIFTTTFFQHPGGGQRDGLVHAIYGGVYGKKHDVIESHPRTGDVMPVLTHLGPAAPSGLTRYASTVFGPDYQNNLFAALFNLQKVSRHILQPAGPTFTTLDQDFLVSDNRDFHPTDVLEDADGSLLVVDTGGWYKICCPTSQLYKPDVLGAIYRIRRLQAPAMPDPRGRKLDWTQANPQALVQRLADPRPAVQERAVQALAKSGAAAVPALQAALEKNPNAQSRRLAVWALTRIQHASARQAVRAALTDPDPVVTLAALHSVSLWRDSDASPKLLALLARGTPPQQRTAAEALGRIHLADAVPALLHAADQIPSDWTPEAQRVLEHSILFALIESRQAEATLAGLSSSRPAIQRAALLAVDQMGSDLLQPDAVTPFLASPHAPLKETALSVVQRHPGWAAHLVTWSSGQLHRQDRSPAETDDLIRLFARLSRDAAMEQFLAQSATDASLDTPARTIALQAMARSGLPELPPSWAEALLVTIPDPNLTLPTLGAAMAMPIAEANRSDLTRAFLKLAHDASHSDELRIQALATCPSGSIALDAPLFQLLLQYAQPTHPVLIRTRASSVLASAQLTPPQLDALARHLPNVGPLELSRLLEAFSRSKDLAIGLKLMEQLKTAPARFSLQPGTLRACLKNYPPEVLSEAEALLNSLYSDAAEQSAHLDQLLGKLPEGDIRRGQEVFNSATAACSSCHAIGYLGGNLGPDLTRIGQIRSARDLLEAILYPNASFVRSYEPVIVTTRDDEEYSGILRSDAPEAVVLATGPGVEMRLSRADIAEMRPGTVSLMPGGMEEVLNHGQLADLLAFLKATRW